MKDLYTENCKILLKESKEGINKWKDIFIQALENLRLLKFSYYPKPIRFNAISQILMAFVAEIEKKILKFIWKLKEPRITQIVLKKKKIQSWRPQTSLFQNILQTIVLVHLVTVTTYHRLGNFSHRN